MISKQLSFFLIVQSVSAAVNLRALQRNHGDNEPLSSSIMMFQSWADNHDKEYATEEEAMDRLKIWMDNHVRIEAHNNQTPKPSFTLGHNDFSDMTNDEFQQRFRLGKYSNTDAHLAKEQSQKLINNNNAEATSVMARHLEEVSPLQLPDQVNWVALGAVTPVKNQGACGSCWAFSTTGALEGAKFVHTGELVTLSEQNLLDCDHKDLGCSGGLMDNAFKFDEKTGGLCSEEDYPYEAKQNRACRTNCTDVPGTIVSTFYDVPPGKKNTLMAALSMQPISVAVQANQFVFQFYKNGVLTDDSCGQNGDLDHGVLAAGYGTDSETGEPYFLIKNSWGESWGENGYIRMSRKSKNKYGMCALLKMASYPEVV